MKRILGLTAVIVVAALALPSTAGARVRTLRATYVNFLFQILDNPPLQSSPTQPPSSGDVAIIRARYRAGRRSVALERTVCTVVDWPHAVCTITIALRGGHVISTDQVDAVSRAPQSLAITGGTGLYRSARGQIVLRQTSDTAGSAVFTIITP
ncbi:MAG: hypothetical protein ACJ76S_02145 [Solirubrobacteraceae bacterium]